MSSIYYKNDLGRLITNVSIVTDEGKQISLIQDVENSWILPKNTNNVIKKYFFLINDSFELPSLDNKFLIEKNIIFSLPNTIHNQSNVTIENIITSKRLIDSNKVIKPILPTDVFSSVDDNINILCEFFNVVQDLHIHVEIFSTKRLIGIIPAVIPASNKNRNYQRTYICNINSSTFNGLNDLITIRIKTSLEKFVSKTIKFTTFQNYSVNQILNK